MKHKKYVNYKRIIESFRTKYNLSYAKSKRMIDFVFEDISNYLIDDNVVKISNFGKLTKKNKKIKPINSKKYIGIVKVNFVASTNLKKKLKKRR